MAKKKAATKEEVETQSDSSVSDNKEYVSPWIAAAREGKQVSYSTDEEPQED